MFLVISQWISIKKMINYKIKSISMFYVPYGFYSFFDGCSIKGSNNSHQTSPPPHQPNCREIRWSRYPKYHTWRANSANFRHVFPESDQKRLWSRVIFRWVYMRCYSFTPDFWGVRQGNLSCFAVTSCPTSEDAKGKVSAVAHVLHAAPGETANFWRVQRISAALRRASAADAAGG